MALLERSEWYDIARSTNWTPSYVTESELFPDLMTGAQGVPMEKWESYDEPYKTSYPEYVKIQREKDAGAYSVKAALERSRMFEEADPGWLSILKSHYGAIALGECAAMSAEARMTRFGRAPGMRNMATFGMMDENRHAQIQLYPRTATAPTDSRSTSVGSAAIDRFLRPVCYQNFPIDLLPAALSCRQFGCKQFDLLDIGRRTEQGRCVGHQGRGDLAVQMCLATCLIGKGIEHTKRRRAKLQCEPGRGAGLGVGERQCAGQEVGKRSLLAGFSFEANKQGELGHAVFLWVNGKVGEGIDETAV